MMLDVHAGCKPDSRLAICRFNFLLLFKIDHDKNIMNQKTDDINKKSCTNGTPCICWSIQQSFIHLCTLSCLYIDVFRENRSLKRQINLVGRQRNQANLQLWHQQSIQYKTDQNSLTEIIQPDEVLPPNAIDAGSPMLFPDLDEEFAPFTFLKKHAVVSGAIEFDP